MGRVMGSTQRNAPTAVVLFTRDLRVHDQPALAEAAKVAERVVPLFVLDEAMIESGFAGPNRLRFLLESLRDLDGSLRALRDARAHEPWRLEAAARRRLGYPEPVVDHAEAAAAFRARRR
jgi:deoxyribodipyrimidine photolyase